MSCALATMAQHGHALQCHARGFKLTWLALASSCLFRGGASGACAFSSGHRSPQTRLRSLSSRPCCLIPGWEHAWPCARARATWDVRVESARGVVIMAPWTERSWPGNVARDSARSVLARGTVYSAVGSLDACACMPAAHPWMCTAQHAGGVRVLICLLTFRCQRRWRHSSS